MPLNTYAPGDVVFVRHPPGAIVRVRNASHPEAPRWPALLAWIYPTREAAERVWVLLLDKGGLHVREGTIGAFVGGPPRWEFRVDIVHVSAGLPGRSLWLGRDELFDTRGAAERAAALKALSQ